MRIRSESYHVIEALAAAVAILEANQGAYIKANQVMGEQEANTNVLRRYLSGSRDGGIAASLVVTPENTQQAQEIINFYELCAVELMGADDTTSFEHTIQRAIRAEKIGYQDLGIIACLPHLYRLRLEQDHRNEIEVRLKATSDYVGEVRETHTLAVRLEYVKFIRNINSYLYALSLDGKHLLKFFNAEDSKLADADPNPDGTITIRARIKSHSVNKYTGARETILHHVAVP